MAEHNFLPESRYQKTILTDEELKNPHALIGKIVHVRPKLLHPQLGLFVYGKNFRGIIPFGEMTIYEVEEVKLSDILIKKNCQITARITGYNISSFILSRKSTMMSALEHLKINDIVPAKLINIYKSTTFLDIGAGINAILPITELSTTFVLPEDIDLFFKGIDSVDVKIVCESHKYPNKFITSLKQAFTPLPIEVGDIVRGKASRILPDGLGQIIEISPVQSGIVDIGLTPWITLNYGCMYTFRVTRIRSKEHDIGIYYSLELICE